MDRLKLELSRTQKANAEQAERLEKQKKQNGALEARIQDLKKTACAEQAELKDLRVKLRMSEHERSQLSLKQGEAAELKKTIHVLESKRRDEVREKDRTITDLGKSVAGERRRRETAEARLQELQAKGTTELDALSAKSQLLQEQLAQAQEETRHSAQLVSVAETDAVSKQQRALDQLEQHRVLLAEVAQEYARLAAKSCAVTAHSKLTHEYAVLQSRAWRLERKLGDSAGQVAELVNLIRHAHDTNALLVRELADLQEECQFYRQTQRVEIENMPPLWQLYDELGEAMHELHEMELSSCLSDNLLATSLTELFHLTYDELVEEHLALNTELAQERQTSRTAQVAQDHLEAELVKTRQEREQEYDQLRTTTRLVDQMTTRAALAEQQKTDLEHQLQCATQQSEAASASHKKAVQQLTETVQRNRMTEDGLRAEIGLLTAELADSEQFQAAYYSLSDEIKSLIARNELAEGEAQQLSKFNAEILGHHNPGQRIMYVDRIRRELAEFKHKHAVSVVECESVAAQNVELLRELEIYRSVSVEHKPRTAVTRISRPPLSSMNQSTTTPFWEAMPVDQRFEDFSYTI